MEEKKTFLRKVEIFHDSYYKKLLIIPIVLILFSFVYLGIFYHKNNDFLYKDISLTGGTIVTIQDKIDTQQIKQDLSSKLQDINTREIYDLTTREQKAIIIETKTSPDETKIILEEYLGYSLNEDNSSFEFTGSQLSESFYKQLIIAIIFAFILMALVVFILFRTVVPSLAVIISAFADILMTLVLVDIFGMKMSSAGIVAFLMLIGYSVDTDILLTNRVLKRGEGNINEKLFWAFKTGLTMTLTSFVAILCALIIVRSFSYTLSQIFTILCIGLFFDVFNTWIMNVSILKWYAEKKK
jgi:preprotein translocase subunit SecF